MRGFFILFYVDRVVHWLLPQGHGALRIFLHELILILWINLNKNTLLKSRKEFR